MRRGAAVFLAVVFLLCAVPRVRAQDGSIQLYTLVEQLADGEYSVEVRMRAETPVRISGLHIALHFDNQALLCTELTADGIFPRGDAQIHTELGQLSFYWEGIQPVEVQGTVMNARFRLADSAADGAYTLRLEVKEAYETVFEDGMLTGFRDIPAYAEGGEIWVGDRLFLSESAVSLYPGQAVYIGANKPVARWITDDPAIASVDGDGRIEAGAPGKTAVYAFTEQQEMARVDVTVLTDAIAGIVVESPPLKRCYRVGEAFDDTGMTLCVQYRSGRREVISGGWSLAYDFASPGEWEVSVSYAGYTVQLSVQVEKGLPVSITSSVYTIAEGRLSKIPAGTTADELLGGLNERDFIRIYAGSVQLPGDALVPSGAAVRLMHDAQAVQTLQVVVTGDVNGDGQITLTDYARIKSHLLGRQRLESPYLLAADLNGDKDLTLTDYAKMKAVLLKKETIVPR